MEEKKIIIRKLTLKMNISTPSTGRNILNGSTINVANIRDTIFRSRQSAFPNGIVRIERLLLQLGDMAHGQFSHQFTQRLQHALQEAWQRIARESDRRCSLSIPGIAGGQPQPLITASNTGESLRLVQSDLIQPLFTFARRCLRPAEVNKLLKYSPAACRKRYRQLMTALQLPLQVDLLPVTDAESRSVPTLANLTLAALCYLLQYQPDGKWLRQSLVSAVFAPLTAAAAIGALPTRLLLALFTPATLAQATLRRGLLRLWQQPELRQRLLPLLDNSTRQSIGNARRGTGPAASEVSSRMNQASVVPCYGDIPQGTGSGLYLRHQQDMTPPLNPSQAQHCSSTGQRPPVPLSVSGAGVVVLWPLLAQLFSELGLLQQQQFISAAAREQAARALDWLVQGGQAAALPALPVNRLLCGLPLLPLGGSPAGNGRDAAARSMTGCASGSGPAIDSSDAAAVSPAHQQQLDAWLSAIASQLPGWQTLTLADIRPLFLQRPGELTGGDDNPCLTVAGEPWDVLLADWPWPLTQLHLPWRPQPVPLHWHLPLTTGTPV